MGASTELTVIGGPSISVTSPAGGATYAFGQKVRASYSCMDDPNGPGISSCLGDVPNHALIDTSTAGPHTFTATALSKDGGTASDTVFYTVAPNNHVKLGHIDVQPGGSIEFSVAVPGPGRLYVLETAPDRGNPAEAAVRRPGPGHFAFGRAHGVVSRARTVRLTVRPDARRPGPGHFAFGRAHAVVSRARTVRLTVRPDARGRLAVRTRHHLQVVVWLTYTPRGGTARTISFQFGTAG